MLIGGYVSYFARRYPPFRWVAPLISAVIFFIVFWLISQFLVTLAKGQSDPMLTTAANQIVWLVIPLTFLVLFVGYIGLLFSLLRHEPPSPPVPPR
jgi:uncharacterized RDD family membrane protein YckC